LAIGLNGGMKGERKIKRYQERMKGDREKEGVKE
jgi:hypothetical protein